MKRVHRLLVDVHRRLLRVSFADRIADEFLALWRRTSKVEAPVQPLRLSRSVSEAVVVDLEETSTLATAAVRS